MSAFITLTPIEQRLARCVAKERYAAARKAGVPDRRVSEGDLDLEGAGSEIAFCRLFNVFPDLEIAPRSSLDDEGDALLRDGRRVDVKSTRYKSGRLIVAHWKADTVDAYALMVGEFPSYRFCGLISAEQAAEARFTADLGRGKCQAVPQAALHAAVSPQAALKVAV